MSGAETTILTKATAEIAKTKCEKGFACLFGKMPNLCEVTYFCGKDSPLICKSKASCFNMVKKDDLHICGCLVRKKIYTIYGY